jgi:hypothetical protein
MAVALGLLFGGGKNFFIGLGWMLIDFQIRFYVA